MMFFRDKIIENLSLKYHVTVQFQFQLLLHMYNSWTADNHTITKMILLLLVCPALAVGMVDVVDYTKLRLFDSTNGSYLKKNGAWGEFNQPGIIPGINNDFSEQHFNEMVRQIFSSYVTTIFNYFQQILKTNFAILGQKWSWCHLLNV